MQGKDATTTPKNLKRTRIWEIIYKVTLITKTYTVYVTGLDDGEEARTRSGCRPSI